MKERVLWWVAVLKMTEVGALDGAPFPAYFGHNNGRALDTFRALVEGLRPLTYVAMGAVGAFLGLGITRVHLPGHEESIRSELEDGSCADGWRTLAELNLGRLLQGQPCEYRGGELPTRFRSVEWHEEETRYQGDPTDV